MTTYLSPKSDITFKKVFGNEHYKSITISFLNSILNFENEKKIIEISFVDTANVREAMSLKDSFIDVHCIDASGTHFLIEMQIDSQVWFIQRALYYLALTFARQLPYGVNYGKLVPVICITILDHIKFTQHDKVVSHYIFTESNTHERLQEQYLELYFIELPKFKKTVEELETVADEWLFFMTSAQDMHAVPQKMQGSQEFQDAFFVLDKMKWTENEFDAYLAQLDKAAKPDRELRAKIEESVHAKAQAVAINLLKMGLSVEKVAQGTGLSIEEIDVLRTKI